METGFNGGVVLSTLNFIVVYYWIGILGRFHKIEKIFFK